MQRQFSAPTLEDAYELAAKALQASIIDIEVKVIQKPHSGFLGFFKKDAIITVSLSNEKENIDINDDVILEVKQHINKLFKNICFDIEDISVSMYNDETVLIEFTGEDAALLIGKEGYRYKALSYLLFNWINKKYGLMLRLEIAQFLSNQEEAIDNYLISIIEIVQDGGMAKTKPLDGVLAHIALKKLREIFPDKYVAIKTNIRGDKYVLINEYRK